MASAGSSSDCPDDIIIDSLRQFENKVLEEQKLLQEDYGIPVHLKDGMAMPSCMESPCFLLLVQQHMPCIS